VNKRADHNEPSDDEVIRRILAGDVNAFEHLLVKYQEQVLNIVRKHMSYDQVEETAQDVFVRAYQSLPTFKGKSSFLQWLSVIAVRTCYDLWRERYRSREFPMSTLTEKHQDWLEKIISDQSSRLFNEQSSQKEAREVLNWALDRLSAEDRMVLELIYLEGLSGKEAAELLGWSVANVKIRSYRSRKKLRTLLAESMET
jgi:RNA polymerase sigma-70 factor (ECF subfamily)